MKVTTILNESGFFLAADQRDQHDSILSGEVGDVLSDMVFHRIFVKNISPEPHIGRELSRLNSEQAVNDFIGASPSSSSSAGPVQPSNIQVGSSVETQQSQSSIQSQTRPKMNRTLRMYNSQEALDQFLKDL